MKNKRPVRQVVLTVLACVLLVAGIVVLLYPTVSKKINSMKTNSGLESFNEISNSFIVPSTMDETEMTEADISENHQENLTFTQDEAERLYRDLYKYNEDLRVNGQSTYGDPFAYADTSIDLNSYGIHSGIIGTLSADSINMTLPIYLGASEYNMSRGAAVLNRTSMPIGGESTNCVIAGHRGMISQTMFDDIVNLKAGDKVTVTNYWEKLTYRVTDTKIIDPKDTNQILIEEGKDILTLITCHPYGSNAKRYLVICQRDETLA